MPSSLVSLFCRPFRAIAGLLPPRVASLGWMAEDGVSVAVWTASLAGAEGGTVHSVRLEIRPSETPRQPFVVTVSPEGYTPASFVVGDLETAHSLAGQQLAVARRLPALEPAAVGADVCAAAESGMFRPATEATGRDQAA